MNRLREQLSSFCASVAAMLLIAAAIAPVTLMAGVAAAFVSQRHEVVPFRHHHFHASSSSSSLSQERQNVIQQQNHPHSKLWHDTLLPLDNTNCHAHPSIDLSIRPSNEGGTGIVAAANIPANTIVLSLPLEEVRMIDIASILDSYNNDVEQDDAVLDLLKVMYESKTRDDGTTTDDGGKRLAILAGILAHLQLTRYKDTNNISSSSTTSTTTTTKSNMYALEQSRRLGLFLDAMPLLPATQHQQSDRNHPFPTHYLYWKDDEIDVLLHGTIAQTKAREVRAGVGLVIREISTSFVLEHGGSVRQQTHILNAILSSFTVVTSRSFGDTAGRDIVNGKGRMLVPLVDMLNHDDETPNVHWTWHVSGGNNDVDGVEKGKGNIVVTTLTNIKEGEELVKCYGWRPAWDIAASYGFVPRLKKARWECSAIPLFPIELDLLGDTPHPFNQMANRGVMLDLTLESNYGILVTLVSAAVDAAAADANYKKTSQRDSMDDEGKRPEQLNCGLQLVSLFRPPPTSTAKEYPFTRRQPCAIVGTKIQHSTSCQDINNQHHHLDAIETILPAFRASAFALSQLRNQYQELGIVDPSQVDASLMVKAATSGDEWDVSARKLIMYGIHERLQYLVDSTQNANYLRLTRQPQSNDDDDDVHGMIDESESGEQHRKLRTTMAKDVKEMEILVLNTLQEELLKGNNDNR